MQRCIRYEKVEQKVAIFVTDNFHNEFYTNGAKHEQINKYVYTEDLQTHVDLWIPWVSHQKNAHKTLRDKCKKLFANHFVLYRLRFVLVTSLENERPLGQEASLWGPSQTKVGHCRAGAKPCFPTSATFGSNLENCGRQNNHKVVEVWWRLCSLFPRYQKEFRTFHKS